MLEIEVIDLVEDGGWVEVEVLENGMWLESTQGDPRVILSDLRHEFLKRFCKGR